MGYYIETGETHDKATYIAERHGGKIVSEAQARKAFDKGKGVICVVSNYIFEAAGFCYNKRELEDFANPGDTRPKQWVVMNHALAAELSGYTRKKEASNG